MRLVTVVGAQAIVKSGVGRFTVTVEVIILPLESTIVTVAVPATPAVVPVNVSADVTSGFPPTPITPVSLEYTRNGAKPPRMWNRIGVTPLTEIVLGLTPSEDDCGVTVTVAVLVAPKLSVTVMVTAVEEATGRGSMVKELPATVALGITAVLLDKAVAP